jgi:hypothetical protein
MCWTANHPACLLDSIHSRSIGAAIDGLIIVWLTWSPDDLRNLIRSGSHIPRIAPPIAIIGLASENRTRYHPRRRFATDDQASRWVRDMFGRVAHRYDLANHLLSFNIDRHWRSRTVGEVRDPFCIVPKPARWTSAAAPATCCWLSKSARGAACFGSDFCHPMLTAAGAKLRKRPPAILTLRVGRPPAPRPRRLARPRHRRLRLSQPGELRCRARGNAARPAARRHGRHPRILATRQPGLSPHFTAFTRAASCP